QDPAPVAQRGTRSFRGRPRRPGRSRANRGRVLEAQARRMARVPLPGRGVGAQSLSHGSLKGATLATTDPADRLMDQIHDKNVVIGSGAMGSATAYHLARRGEPVLLLEQFAIGHDRGSSHGAARITRHSYADPRYARLMLDAFRAWRELEADAGQNLYLRTGGVSFCPAGVDY